MLELAYHKPEKHHEAQYGEDHHDVEDGPPSPPQRLPGEENQKSRRRHQLPGQALPQLRGRPSQDRSVGLVNRPVGQDPTSDLLRFISGQAHRNSDAPRLDGWANSSASVDPATNEDADPRQLQTQRGTGTDEVPVDLWPQRREGEADAQLCTCSLSAHKGPSGVV